MKRFLAKAALLPQGWEKDVLISVDETGRIAQIEPGAAPSTAHRLDGPVIPGMANLHSHAFQRAMAGFAEYTTSNHDSFWTWRKRMYDFVQRIEPDALEDIAEKLYRQMRSAGYTHVGEFHYLHHTPDGTPYDDPAHLSHAMIRAAKKAEIGITLLPVLYSCSGFGGKPPEDGQRRFINSAEIYIDLVSSLSRDYRDDTQVKIGAAFHSLRAVTPDMIAQTVPDLHAIDPNMPIHIHVAEQEKEVEDCLHWSGKRPVHWLLDHAPVDEHWCLVHATHMNEHETKALARSGAIAGLCPTTEANLGDGLFNLPAFIDAGGAFGIGSDSHVCINPLEELRLLEYGQRLTRRARAIARTNDTPHTGTFLYQSAARSGAQALGANAGTLEPGRRADFIVIDTNGQDIPDSLLLDTLIFSDRLRIGTVYRGGIAQTPT